MDIEGIGKFMLGDAVGKLLIDGSQDFDGHFPLDAGKKAIGISQGIMFGIS